MQEQNELQEQTLPQVDSNSEFDNLESIESIYSAETIDVISAAELAELSQAAANEANIDGSSEEQTDSPSEIYCLTSARLVKQEQMQERRANKSRLTDRRATARLTASGEPQPDRREANRLANINAMRKDS